jgi:hypothetical protein
MKKVLAFIAAALLIGAGSSAQAGTATGTFNVNITLTSACTVNTAATAANFAYTSLQVAASTFASSFTLQCTNTLPIVSVALDSLAVTDAATNLAYTLALGATPASTGAANPVAVTGSMAGGQAGTCALASCTNAASANKTRTVTVTF